MTAPASATFANFAARDHQAADERSDGEPRVGGRGSKARGEVVAAAGELDHAQLQGGSDEPDADESERAGGPRAYVQKPPRRWRAIMRPFALPVLHSVIAHTPGGVGPMAGRLCGVGGLDRTQCER